MPYMHIAIYAANTHSATCACMHVYICAERSSKGIQARNQAEAFESDDTQEAA